MAAIGLHLHSGDDVKARIGGTWSHDTHAYIALDFSQEITLYFPVGVKGPVLARQLAAVLLKVASEADAIVNPPPADEGDPALTLNAEGRA